MSLNYFPEDDVAEKSQWMQINIKHISVDHKRKIVSIPVMEIYRDILSQGAPQKYGVLVTSD